MSLRYSHKIEVVEKTEVYRQIVIQVLQRQSGLEPALVVQQRTLLHRQWLASVQRVVGQLRAQQRGGEGRGVRGPAQMHRNELGDAVHLALQELHRVRRLPRRPRQQHVALDVALHGGGR